MNPSEETDRLARDASLPIIANRITESVDRLGAIINEFGKYLDDIAPDISTKEDKDNGIIHKDA
jgi:hypothetical protein